MSLPFTAVVVVGGGDVLVELTEQVAELRQGVADTQQNPPGGQVVGIAQTGSVNLSHLNTTCNFRYILDVQNLLLHSALVFNPI